MKIAIFFSGRIESYEESLDQLLELKRVYNPTFFCSLNSSELTPYIQKFLHIFEIRNGQYNIEETKFPEWITTQLSIDPLECPPKYIKYNGVNQYKTYSSLYHNYKNVELIHHYCANNDTDFDIIVKYRADLRTSELLPINTIPDDNTIVTLKKTDAGQNEQLVMINDMIFYSTKMNMYKFCSVFANLENLCISRCIFHPEYLQYVYGLAAGLKYDTIINIDITLNSSRRNMDNNIFK